jgi:hypothetical protein
MHLLWAGLVVLVAGAGAAASDKVVRETWDAAFLDDQKAGHFHTTVVESQRQGQTVLRITRELRLKFMRGSAVAEVRASTGDEETPDGKLLGAFMTLSLARDKQLKLTGQVANGVLNVSVDDPNIPKENQVKRAIPLPEDLITLLTEESLLGQKKAKPGDRLSYRLFEPTVDNVIRVEVEVKNWESVPLDGVNRKLLRVVAKPEKIQQVQLPSQTLYYDEQYRVVMSQGELPGLGELTLKRTTKDKALAPLGKLRDLGEQSVVLDRLIPSPHQKQKIVYIVHFAKEVEGLEKAFATGDNRQSVKKLSDKSLELTITAVRTPSKQPAVGLVGKEYLQSNYFITSDDELVRKHAASAVGDETDPWKKSQLIEKWVKQHMHGMAFTEAMAPASHVAKTLSGDCTEFAMLAAAMCRAQDIPSRTAIGLVYYNDRGQAKLGYHMWTEVNIRGEWLALDATLGQGSVGPGHVKITDHSWHNTRSMTPLLPVMRVMMGRPQMDVLTVE